MTRAQAVAAIVMVFASTALASSALGQGATGSAKSPPTAFVFDTTKPISLAADRAEVDNKLQVARFIGNVVALQDTAVLNADTVVIQYEREQAESPKPTIDQPASTGIAALTSGNGGIKTLVASGSVKMIQNERRVFCEQVTFDQAKGTVTLTGNPRVYSGTDLLTGNRIVVHIADERVEVIGSGSSRVQVTVVPQSAQDSLNPAAQKRLQELSENPPPKDEKPKAVKTGDDDADAKDEKPIVEEPTP
ncbi:MAG: hypothetical protein IT350_12205 [Deltaproteobacteria bacterium]|nr:hypothetical protein [Deltaproteobacteria bacterium]